MLITICCGLAITGATLIGRRSSGLSYGYQVAGEICITQLVDTNRPSDSYALVSKQPFCLLNNNWSPDHRYAAIRNFATRSLSIATGRNGSEWQRVFDFTQVQIEGRSLAWASDSQELAFLTNNISSTTIGIIEIENNVPGKPRLFTVEAVHPIPSSAPVWSPDGQLLAFVAYNFYGQGSEELYLFNINSGEVRRLTDNHFRDDSPSWSPDGTQLVFTSAEDGYNELHIIDVATLKRHQLTRFTLGYFPSWSPDGQNIIFISNIDHGNDLYIINPDGTGLRRLSNNHLLSSVLPMWLFPS